MQNFPIGFSAIFSSLWRNKEILRNLIYREIVGRYKGSIFGLLWSFFTPVLMLLVYTFVFGCIFKSRWELNASESKISFALLLFAGLLIFNLFADCLNRSPTLITGNINYVKKVLFPLEILPVVTLCGALFHCLASFAVWLIAYCLLIGIPHWTVLLSFLVIIPFAFFVLGWMWLFAAVGVYVRDMSQIIGIILPIVMFMTPLFYPITVLPKNLQTIMLFNPLTATVEAMRDLLYWGRLPAFNFWFIGYIISITTALLGFTYFQKVRRGFADVL